MKVFVHHDLAGAIHSFVIANAPEGAGMMLSPKPGRLVTELEGLPAKIKPDDLPALREIARKNRVEIARARLLPARK